MNMGGAGSVSGRALCGMAWNSAHVVGGPDIGVGTVGAVELVSIGGGGISVGRMIGGGAFGGGRNLGA